LVRQTIGRPYFAPQFTPVRTITQITPASFRNLEPRR